MEDETPFVDDRPFMDPEEEKAVREKLARLGIRFPAPPGRFRLGLPTPPESLRESGLWEGFDEWREEIRRPSEVVEVEAR